MIYIPYYGIFVKSFLMGRARTRYEGRSESEQVEFARVIQNEMTRTEHWLIGLDPFPTTIKASLMEVVDTYIGEYAATDDDLPSYFFESVV